MAKTEINNINSLDVDLEHVSKGIRQFLEIKRENPNTLLLFRMGDFYETFFEDALTLSKELELTLTGRDAGDIGRIPLAGIPAKAIENYMKKLIDRGIKVTVCEQLEDPKLVKGGDVVKRGVVRIVTPGTIIENNYLEQSSNNYICSIFEEKGILGFAYSDISTGEFKVTQAPLNMILSELARIKPVEIIGPSVVQKVLPFQIVPEEKLDLPDEITSLYTCSKVPSRVFSESSTESNLKHVFNIQTLDVLGYKDCKSGYRAASALIAYMWENLKDVFPKIDKIEHYELSEYVLMDTSTRKNLELVETIRDKNKYGSLYWAIDRTHTNMGARLLKTWLCQPLKKITEIEHRQNAVEVLTKNNSIRQKLIELLDGVYDIQRISTRICSSSIMPKDFISLRNSISLLPDIAELLTSCGLDIFEPISSKLPDLVNFASLIYKTINDDPPNVIKEGGIIKEGVNETLDTLRDIKDNRESWLSEFEEHEKEKTGIKSLKIGYNRFFGYYIEVTNSFINLVPSNYIRRQTLAGAERFITEELKNYEDEAISSQSKVIELEYQIYTNFKSYSNEFVPLIREAANLIAQLDVLVSFASMALESNYVKPELTEGSEFIVKNGRHPVLEKILPLGTYVPNDLELSDSSGEDITRFMILTGPNMAGKSTYMRQNALIALLAQIGSFVPADYVKIGVADKIFTRVGASDDLSLGQSTFMVEMIETAYILNNATANSIILIDEIGRGTSTYDGVAIAWAVAEHIVTNINARCIFATHYHELNVMSKSYPQIKNYRITISDTDGKIEFLRKIVQGSTNKSYGTHVAQMAGLPIKVVKRSQELMLKLQKDFSKDLSTRKKTLSDSTPQLSLFEC
ncbi:MAG: DNA mismatch repair protein MutS [Candidatus Gastranaerophilales bacterium]|nr:DNA mismatch repair protein MutS [Candidatus Gastranaerophilales bacterium]